MSDDGLALHGAGDGVVAVGIVELLTCSDAGTRVVEYRDSETIEGVDPEFFRVKMEVEVL